MANQMAKSLGKRRRFAHFRPKQFSSADRLLIMAGFAPWSAITKLGDETRKSLRDDIRGNPNALRSILVSLTTYLHATKRQTAPMRFYVSTRTPYAEVVIPQNMGRWAIDLSKLSGSLTPGQEMANVFANEFYEPSKKEPPYAPFSAPMLRGGPRPPLELQRSEKTSHRWRYSVARKSSGPSRQVSLQTWILYIVRFTITGDLRKACDAFGGLATQLSYISISLHFGITEDASFAIA